MRVCFLTCREDCRGLGGGAWRRKEGFKKFVMDYRYPTFSVKRLRRRWSTQSARRGEFVAFLTNRELIATPSTARDRRRSGCTRGRTRGTWTRPACVGGSAAQRKAQRSLRPTRRRAMRNGSLQRRKRGWCTEWIDTERIETLQLLPSAFPLQRGPWIDLCAQGVL